MLEELDKITIDEIARTIDSGKAYAIYCNAPFFPSSSLEPAVFTMPSEGTWRRNNRGEYEILVKISPLDMMAGEGDWDYALGLESTQIYIQWQKEGKLPPPLTVVRNYKGELISCNRRRWLAAIEAKTEYLYCWYSPFIQWVLPEQGEYWQAELKRLYIDCNLTIEQIKQTSVGDILHRFKMYPECIPSEIRKSILEELNQC